MKKNEILLKNGLIELNKMTNDKTVASKESLATIIANFAYFGYVPSKEIVEELETFSEEDLNAFWNKQDAIFRSFFCNFLSAKEGVVYKNFPKEVLNKTESEYWISQIFMYLGLEKEFFTEDEEEREEQLVSVLKLKVINKANSESLKTIYTKFINKKNSLLPDEQEQLGFLLDHLNVMEINISHIPFKMNGVFLAKKIYERKGVVSVNNLTDLFRFAASIGAPQNNVNERISYFKFSRAERKQILRLFLTLDLTKFDEDVAMRPESFKALFKSLRAGDYAWAKPVSVLYDRLYNKKVKSAKAKALGKAKIDFNVMKSRAGMFVRAFHEAYEREPENTIKHMLEALNSLDISQLLKFKKYVGQVNKTYCFIAKPKSSWELAKPIVNDKVYIKDQHIKVLVDEINTIIKSRLENVFPNGILKGEDLNLIKLPSNDQEVDLGRGTIKRIPLEAKYLRSATMWDANDHRDNVWFDNGWNFISLSKGKLDSALCWNQVNSEFGCFSGDPVVNYLENKIGTQIIDLDLEKLRENTDIDYAVWSVLSYNNINFNAFKKVYACVQFLENQMEGELFEPVNLEMQMELKGNAKNKIVLVVDIKNNQMIILDQPFPKLSTKSAYYNKAKIREFLDHVLKNLKFIPSVFDLVENVKDGDVPFVVSDENLEIKEGSAYVFKKENVENKFDDILLDELLKLKQ